MFLFVDPGLRRSSHPADVTWLVKSSANRTRPSVFRICGRDDQQGTVAAEYIHRNYPNDKIAVFDDKSTAGKGIADVVEAQLKRFGEQVIRQSYVAGEKDYRAFGLKNEEGSGARRLYRRL
ncbi:hypothetical protein [Bradyrhizobium sp. CCBAU 21362]|uniref:hypothetical protein n=1 Tax=Bradyrhizobium sp. CCBAU 21362 TaxID=1325082 RepID=UPI0023055292|nr:hypothetical protein [Bradyrhizobium sp. CCBAU 21362]